MSMTINIAIINRKGGVSKSTLSRYLSTELNRTGNKTTLVDTDVYHCNMEEDDNIIYNPSDEEYDLLLESNDSVIFDTGGLIIDTTNALCRMCDIIIIPTGIHTMETKEIQPILNHLQQLGVDMKKVVIVPTRVHHLISSNTIKDRLNYNIFVTSAMRRRSSYRTGRPSGDRDTEMYLIAKEIKNKFLLNNINEAA